MCIVGKMAQDVGMVESIAVSSPSSLVVGCFFLGEDA